MIFGSNKFLLEMLEHENHLSVRVRDLQKISKKTKWKRSRRGRK